MITWQLTNNTVVFVNNIYNLNISFTGHVQGTVSKTFKNAYFWKCVIVFWMAKRKKSYELVSKAKIELNLFQQFFTPHTPPQKQGESETTLSPDLPSTRTIRSTVPFRKCFKSCGPMSDLVIRYGPQAMTRFTMPSFSPIRTRNL
jgi:hypothetical protein